MLWTTYFSARFKETDYSGIGFYQNKWLKQHMILNIGMRRELKIKIK